MREVVARHAALDVIRIRAGGTLERVEGAHAHALEAAHARLVIRGVQAQHDSQWDVLWKVADGQARCRAVLVADLFAIEGVAAEAVAVQLGSGQARAPGAVLVGQVEGGLDVALLVITDAHFRRGAVFLRQRTRNVFDGAADGVLAVQSALRAAQHFDALHVENVEQRALRTGHVDVVKINAHARIHAPDGIGLAHAANEGRQRGVRAARGVHGQVRHALLQVGQVLDIRPFQGLGGKRRDGQRHVLQPLFAAAGRDRHGFHAFFRIAGFLGRAGSSGSGFLRLGLGGKGTGNGEGGGH